MCILIPFFGFAQWKAVSDQDAIAERIRHAVNDAAHALGGTFSAEHGIGRTLTGEMARYKPAVEIALMQAIKQASTRKTCSIPGGCCRPLHRSEVAGLPDIHFIDVNSGEMT